MNIYLKYILCFLLPFLISLGANELIKRISLKFQYTVKPRPDRWHKRPTSVFGGIGIFVSFLLAYLILIRVDGEVTILLVTGTLIFLVGLLDDIFEITPPAKFLLQILIALILIYFGFLMDFSDFFILNFILTLFWIVGITNAFNLLDNIDGLAGGIALIVCAFFTLFLVTINESDLLPVPIALGGALLGFLIHNFKPASIFMGDSGSLFIGFFISGLSLIKKFPHTSSIFYVLVIPVLLLLVPIFDTTFVTITRILSGKPVSSGGRDHTSHRLVSIGLTERQAVLLLYSIALASGTIAYIVYRYSLNISIVFILLLLLVVIFFGIYLARIRNIEHPSKPFNNVPLIPVLVDIAFKRKLFEIALDFTLITLSYYSAYLLRFEGTIPQFFIVNFLKTLPLVIIFKLASLFMVGIYGGVWRYFSITDLVRMFEGVCLGTGLIIVAISLIFRLEGFSRAVFISDLMLTFFFLTGARLSFRVMDRLIRQKGREGEKILIYGAGDGGELLLREILNNRDMNLSPVGFIDDDETKWSKRIHGYPIFSNQKALANIIRKHNITQIIISTFKMETAKTEKIEKFCNENNIRLRRLSIKLED
ncbi:MAG TPA: hypothetical protein VII00_05850 [bacterium]